MSHNNDTEPKWFVMRDLKRANAKEPAYKLLERMNMEIFIPKEWHIVKRNGKRIREEKPFIQDLLFVHEVRQKLDSIVAETPTLQYRWLRNSWRKPMTVKEKDMELFINAVKLSENRKFYLPSELTPAMCGRSVLVVGGLLDGYEGKLLTVRGSKVRRLLVELPGFFTMGVEVNPEYIKLL